MTSLALVYPSISKRTVKHIKNLVLLKSLDATRAYRQQQRKLKLLGNKQKAKSSRETRNSICVNVKQSPSQEDYDLRLVRMEESDELGIAYSTPNHNAR